jgi:3-oxoacyl-[acyl-carrier protein] reductase
MRLQGKVVIVTGGGAGIGEEYCRGLAREGAKVTIVDILPRETLERLVTEIEAEGGEAEALQADVSSQADTQRMANQVVERWGVIDGLVNNAVWQPARPFDQYTVEEFDKMMAVNVRGVWLCIVAVFPHMKRQGKGKVVNIASQTFFSGWWNLAPYVASKGAVIGLTRALAREISPLGVRVNCLSPGLTVTEGSLREVEASIHPGHVNEWLDAHVEQQCVKHPGYPQDLVGPLIYLLSDDSDFMTGQTMVVDGGWVMH